MKGQTTTKVALEVLQSLLSLGLCVIRACGHLTWADRVGETLCQPAPLLQFLLVPVTVLLCEEGLEVPTEGGGGISPFPQLLAKLGQLSRLILNEDVVFPKTGGRENVRVDRE